MIAAGMGHNAQLSLFRCERSDLVVGAAQLERADGLQIFRLDEDGRAVPKIASHQRSAHGNAAQQGSGLLNVPETDHVSGENPLLFSLTRVRAILKSAVSTLGSLGCSAEEITVLNWLFTAEPLILWRTSSCLCCLPHSRLSRRRDSPSIGTLTLMDPPIHPTSTRRKPLHRQECRCHKIMHW